MVGIDDSQKSDARSSVIFEIYGNAKEMGEKPVLLARSPVLSNATLRSWAFDLELGTRFKELHLVVTDAVTASPPIMRTGWTQDSSSGQKNETTHHRRISLQGLR
jgi:hypothetical protein